MRQTIRVRTAALLRRIEDVTGLGRTVDPRLPSNLLAVAVSGLGGLAVALRGLFDSGSADLGSGLTTLLAVFLAWAVGRELDPDDPRSAALAMAVTLGIALVYEVEIAGAAVALLATRLIVGSVGRSLKPVDYFVLIGVAAFSGTRPELWPAGALLAVAVLVARPKWSRLASLGAASAALFVALAISATPSPNLRVEALAVTFLAVVASLASVPVRPVAARADSGLYVISTSRVALARLATGSVIAATVVLTTQSIPTVAPLLASIASVPIVALLRRDSVVTNVGQIAQRGHVDGTSASDPGAQTPQSARRQQVV